MSILNRLVLIAGIALSFVAHSQSLQGQQGGTITFNGLLTEAPCTCQISDNTVNAVCYRSGEITTFSSRLQAGNTLSNALIPDSIGEVNVSPVPSDSGKHIVTVSYR